MKPQFFDVTISIGLGRVLESQSRSDRALNKVEGMQEILRLLVHPPAGLVDLSNSDGRSSVLCLSGLNSSGHKRKGLGSLIVRFRWGAEREG